MKTFFTVMLTGLMLLHQIPSWASHAVGGEITWSCVGNGKYKFRFIFYTDCNGIFPGNSFSINTNVPGVSTIQTQLIQINDLILPGFQSDGTTQCYNCTTNPPSGVYLGIMRESIYESDSIFLPGVPPPTGWWFYAGECCRFVSLSNIPASASLDFTARAAMFPFNGQVPGQCSDNSPYFVEKPKPTYCIGQPLEMNYATKDIDGDQQLYDWAYPIDELGNNVFYSAFYSVNNPFPGPQQNPLNTLSNLNINTGQMLLTNHNIGVYASVIKATSFKCNQKVAEVYREFSTVFVNNCPPLMGGTPNHIPICNAPFFDNTTGLQTSYSDTVTVGDTVIFFLNATDVDLFTNGSMQQITITGAGNQFGTNFTDPSSGCQNPPCAALTQSLPITATGNVVVGFYWAITCDHLYDTTACPANSKTYYFNIKIRDNFCYSNGVRSIPFNITVVGAKITVASNVTTLCLTSNPVALTAIPSGGIWSGSGVSGSTFDPALSGIGTHIVNYSYSDSSGCVYGDQIEITVNSCTGLSEINHDPIFEVTPSFTSSSAKATLNYSDSGHLIITSINGTILFKATLTEKQELILPFENFARGFYQVTFSGNKYYATQKLVKY